MIPRQKIRLLAQGDTHETFNLKISPKEDLNEDSDQEDSKNVMAEFDEFLSGLTHLGFQQ